MNEASKNVLATSAREWNKFVAEKEKMEKAAHQVAEIVTKIIIEDLAFLKTQNIGTNSDSPDTMALMGSPVQVIPEVDATYPSVKAMVHLRCAGAARSIVVNPNLSVSAGGVPFTLDQLSKGIPEKFAINAAEFLKDAFLSAAKAETSKGQTPHQPKS